MTNRLAVFCETLSNPIGIDNLHPRFSWKPSDDAFCAPQATYCIRVCDGDVCVWNSGEKHDCRSVAVPYDGVPLKSFTIYRFEIRCTLTDGSVYFGNGTFETGILEQSEWLGDFLCYPNYQKRASPVFVTKMNVLGKIKSCRAYFCGLGYGELYINGNKTENSILDPAWTDYTQRVLYRTFDVTELVNEGENKIRVLLGDGWMAHNHKYFEVSKKPPLPWYHEPCFLLNIRVTYEDGSVETFAPNGENCRANSSEILSQNLFDGETYSAPRAEELKKQEMGELLESDGWIAPQATQISGIRSAQIMPPIRETEIIQPIRMASIDPSTYTVDLGINFSGYLRISVKGNTGSSVQIRYAEIANEDDTLNQENLRYAQCCDTYFLEGSGKTEVYSPRFTYRGFRFAEIKLIGNAKVFDAVGVRVNTAVERIGRFSCDNEMLNRIYRMLINTELNNMHSVPTDCPQRDERLGWMNDNTMRLEQNFMNLDSQLFYEKWLRDLRDTQKKINTGAVPDSCPYYYGRSPARWNTTVFVSLPYMIYQYYHDMQPMKEHWQAVLWYMEFQKTKLTAEGLIDEYYVGEWCPPMKDSILEDLQSAFAREIRNQLATSCFYYMESLICVKMANLLGDAETAKNFEARMEHLKQAINRKFFDAEKGAYVPVCQGNNIFPLFLGIVPDGYEERVAQTLISCIVKKDFCHISTGSHMTRFLFETLTKIGQTDLGIRMLCEKTYPSFGYMLENGATALWERWEKSFGFMTSHDHPMTGGFGVWFFKALGGISIGLDSDSERLTIEPIVPNSLQYVNCSRIFRTGEVVCNWYKVERELHFDIEIPWNTNATVRIRLNNGVHSQITVNGKPLEKLNLPYQLAQDALLLECTAGYRHIVIKENKYEFY